MTSVRIYVGRKSAIQEWPPRQGNFHRLDSSDAVLLLQEKELLRADANRRQIDETIQALPTNVVFIFFSDVIRFSRCKMS